MHAKAIENFYTCRASKDKCEKVGGGEVSKILKCDSYGLKHIKATRSKPSCVGLSTLADFAINNSDQKKLATIITESKDVDMSLSHIHETPLTLAALNARIEIVRWLLSEGAKVNFQTKNGYTPLMFAVTSRSENKKDVEETIKVLLAAGADKSLRNSRGESAMDLARTSKNDIAAKLLK